MGFWAAAFVLLYGAALLLSSVSLGLRPYSDTLIMVALGAACFINFSRNRTLHCGITGPIFVVGAVAAGFIESGKWAFDLRVVWGIVLVGVALAFAIEWRTAGPDDRSNGN